MRVVEEMIAKLILRGERKFFSFIFNEFRLYSKVVIPDDKKFNELNRWIAYAGVYHE